MSRTAVLVAGFWLGLLVASWVMAGTNLRMGDRVLGSDMRPEVAARLAGVSPEDRRMVLRHLGGEINRWMFRRGFWLQLAALLLTLVQGLGLSGEITTVGRAIEFLPRPLPPDLGRRFGMLHGAYVAADLAKAAAIAAAAVVLLRR